MNYVLQLCYIFQTNKGRSKVILILEHCLSRRRHSHSACALYFMQVSLRLFPKALVFLGTWQLFMCTALDWDSLCVFPFLYQTLSCSFKLCLTLLWFLFLCRAHTPTREVKAANSVSFHCSEQRLNAWKWIRARDMSKRLSESSVPAQNERDPWSNLLVQNF